MKIKGLKDQGNIEIECNSNSLWHLDSSYDLIYFQWPGPIFRRTIDDEDLVNLTKQFDIIIKNIYKLSLYVTTYFHIMAILRSFNYMIWCILKWMHFITWVTTVTN